MTDYQQKAIDFLKACNATMDIEFMCADVNQNWNDNAKRNKYRFTITTPRGKMSGDFWDSIHNTEITLMTVKQYCEKKYKMRWEAAYYKEHVKMIKEFDELVKDAKPTPYDILACLQKYEVGTMNDFFHEFGYEVNDADDIFCFLNTYNAVVKEYHDLCRIFTPKQMEMLREIQ